MGDPSNDFATFKLGKEQSPIDIKTAGVEKAKLDKIEYGYQPFKLNTVNNGHTATLDYGKGKRSRSARATIWLPIWCASAQRTS